MKSGYFQNRICVKEVVLIFFPAPVDKALLSGKIVLVSGGVGTLNLRTGNTGMQSVEIYCFLAILVYLKQLAV